MTKPTIYPKPPWVTNPDTGVRTFLQKEVLIRYGTIEAGTSGYLNIGTATLDAQVDLVDQWAPVGGANG